MSHCNQYRDPVDAELHRFGLCMCAIYTNAPPRLPWEHGDIERLLDLVGFALCELPDGTFYAHDDRRGLYVPFQPFTMGGVPYPALGDLVVRAVCAHALAGPMTAEQARAKLAPYGVVLRGVMHRGRGWEWVAHHTATDHRIDHAFNLKALVEMATGYVRRLGTHQPVLEEIAAQAPKPKLRPEQLRAAARPPIDAAFAQRARPRRRAPARAADVGEQLTLDVFAGGSAPPPEPESPRGEGVAA